MISIINEFDLEKARQGFFNSQVKKLENEKQIPGTVADKLHQENIQKTKTEASGKYPTK